MDILQKIAAFFAAIFLGTTPAIPAGQFATPLPTPQMQTTEIFLAGDVMLGRSVMATTIEKKDMIYPFRNVAQVMSEADLTFINLENPIIENCPRHTTGFTFCALPSQLLGLRHAGVDVVTVANNHTQNYGKKGLDDTKYYIENEGIQVTGMNNLVVKMVGDYKFGFLGFEKSQQVQPQLSQAERQLLIDSDTKVDVLIVGIHWGTEYQDKALPGVRILAREIVELGADVIVGHHPHWVQDWEYIDGKPVYYSLGNFVFDQMWSQKTREGLAVVMKFENGKFVSDEKLPVFMKNIGQPEWVTQ